MGLYGPPGAEATSTLYWVAVGMLKMPISQDEPPTGWSPTPAGGLGGGTWKGGMLGPFPKPCGSNWDVGIELTRVISGRAQISRQIRRQRTRQTKWQTWWQYGRSPCFRSSACQPLVSSFSASSTRRESARLFRATLENASTNSRISFASTCRPAPSRQSRKQTPTHRFWQKRKQMRWHSSPTSASSRIAWNRAESPARNALYASSKAPRSRASFSAAAAIAWSSSSGSCSRKGSLMVTPFESRDRDLTGGSDAAPRRTAGCAT